MTELEALLLGIVQGLTEFLPISSSGHLILVPWILDFEYLQEHPKFNKTFDVALHIGTLVAVLYYFRHELAGVLRGVVSSVRRRSISTFDERLAWLLAIGTVPAVIAGALGEGTIEEDLGQPWQIAIMLAVFGILLGLADRLPQRLDLEGLRWRSALAIGAAQAISLIPGTSRSGVTITAGRALGLTRESAARFSFLLLAPVTSGAVVYEGIDLAREGLPEGAAGPVIVGILASAVSGFAAIWVLLRYVQRHNYDIFVWYRLLIAAAVVMVIATGLRPATFG